MEDYRRGNEDAVGGRKTEDRRQSSRDSTIYTSILLLVWVLDDLLPWVGDKWLKFGRGREVESVKGRQPEC